MTLLLVLAGVAVWFLIAVVAAVAFGRVIAARERVASDRAKSEENPR